jgi:hypothetical protein
MSDSEKAVTWGLLALIAWELWPQQGGASNVNATFGDNVPEWVKQLSWEQEKIDFFHRTRGLWGAC